MPSWASWDSILRYPLPNSFWIAPYFFGYLISGLALSYVLVIQPFFGPSVSFPLAALPIPFANVVAEKHAAFASLRYNTLDRSGTLRAGNVMHFVFIHATILALKGGVNRETECTPTDPFTTSSTHGGIPAASGLGLETSDRRVGEFAFASLVLQHVPSHVWDVWV